MIVLTFIELTACYLEQDLSSERIVNAVMSKDKSSTLKLC